MNTRVTEGSLLPHKHSRAVFPGQGPGAEKQCSGEQSQAMLMCHRDPCKIRAVPVGGPGHRRARLCKGR